MAFAITMASSFLHCVTSFLVGKPPPPPFSRSPDHTLTSLLLALNLGGGEANALDGGTNDLTSRRNPQTCYFVGEHISHKNELGH